ncbi:MAG: hypothetical protein ACRC8Y_13065 [Chroococcales cyanobacterium]
MGSREEGVHVRSNDFSRYRVTWRQPIHATLSGSSSFFGEMGFLFVVTTSVVTA